MLFQFLAISIKNYIGIWSFVSNVTSNSTGDINIEAEGVNLYFQCNEKTRKNLECVLAGVDKSYSSTHSFIIEGETISLADYPSLKGTFSKTVVVIAPRLTWPLISIELFNY